MASVPTSVNSDPAEEKAPIPPLEAGDRLSRAEFERRYQAMPNQKKAELVEGIVYIPSPVCFRQHGQPHARILSWLGFYEANTPRLLLADNTTMRLDLDNESQPDVLLMIDPKSGGQARISDDDYVEGAPELVIEVAASSVSYDLHVKANAYRRNGIREYIIWCVRDQRIDWFVLRDGRYDLLGQNDKGYYMSTVFPGLWLNLVALLTGDLGAVFATLQEGLSSPEHTAFVTR